MMVLVAPKATWLSAAMVELSGALRVPAGNGYQVRTGVAS